MPQPVKKLRAKEKKKSTYKYYCSVCLEEVESNTEECPACHIKLKGIYKQDYNVGKF